MALYSIAGLVVNMNPTGKILLKQGEKYLLNSSTCQTDITINSKNPDFSIWCDKFSDYGFDINEYSWYGYDFYRQILNYNGFFFHSSAISVNGIGIVFSANSGTGKSTHSSLWKSTFGKENVIIINDDKPVVRKTENGFYVYGTPFSGKTDTSANIGVPLRAICFLEQSKENYIKAITAKQALPLFFSQTLREKNIEFMDKLIALTDGVLNAIPVYSVGCNISSSAVLTVYNRLKNDGIFN